MDTDEIRDELEQTRLAFHDLVQSGDLRRRSNGTRWTNRHLLFHLVFGYLIVRTLMPLVHVLGRLGWSRAAPALESSGKPPHPGQLLVLRWVHS